MNKITTQLVAIPTENIIISNWKIENPLVSVCCLTYNQESYIESAINGFLQQKTDFPFEIIIHDDASTDSTASIIQDYQEKYPSIIRAVIQEENQYSQGVSIINSILSPLAKGEFIALCEGDDYWVSQNKLQIQVNQLISHGDINISFHPAIGETKDGKRKILANYYKKNTVVPFPKVVFGGGEFMPTASILYRKKINDTLIAFYEEFGKFPAGDVVLQALFSAPNGALYVPDIFSVYRISSSGSWTERISNNRAKLEHVKTRSLILYDSLNCFFDNRYYEIFKKRKLLEVLHIITNVYLFSKDFRQTIYFENCKEFSLLDRVKVQIIKHIKTVRYLFYKYWGN